MNSLRQVCLRALGRCLGIISVTLLLGTLTATANAQRHERPAARRSVEKPEGQAPNLDEYRLPLAVAYMAPLAAAGLGAWLTPHSQHAWLWGVSILAAPIVHWAHGNMWGGLRSLLGVTLAPLAGSLAGYGIARISGACDDGSSSGTCVGTSLFGLAAGGILGYLAFAVVDVVLFGEVERPVREHRARATPHFAPIFGPSLSGNASSTELQGLSIGATLHL